MKLKELRHMLNALPLNADSEDVVILDPDTDETFTVTCMGVDVDGTPVIKIQLD